MDLCRSIALLALLAPLAAAAADATTPESKPTPPQARMTAAECAGLVAGRRPPTTAIDVTGAADRAAALLDLLAPTAAVAAAVA